MTSQTTRTIWIARLLRGLAAGLLALGAQQAMAGVCKFSTLFGGTVTSMVRATAPLLAGNLTVGRDLPVGSIIYTQKLQFGAGKVVNVACGNAPSTLHHYHVLTSTPKPLANWSGKYTGKMYQTGIPGIGAAIYNNDVGGDAVPRDYTSGLAGNTVVVNQQQRLEYQLLLFKIGDVSPGVIQGANLPTVQYSIVSDNTLPILEWNFSGSINIVSQTCQTPNVNVDLGSNRLKDMATVGSGSPWKAFSIALNNCPAFRGTYTNSNPPVTYNDGTSSMTSPDRANSINFQLDPATSVVDKTNGVIALAGTNAATGVGIQIARGGSTTGVQYATLLPSNLTLNTSATGNYTIPLQARYYRTNATATPGAGNAAVTFTLNYQ